MLDLFGSVKDFLKVSETCIDNGVFRLHYKVTAALLFGFSLLVTATQFIGDPIDCLMEDMDQKVMDTYCWIHSTFTIADYKDGNAGAHPGVGPEQGETTKYHRYYQWVCFALFFQGLLFCVPRKLWKQWEGGLIKELSSELRSHVLGKCKDVEQKHLFDYFRSNLDSHNLYASKYLVCEAFNLANVLGQIFFTNLFLGGEFATYGLRFLAATDGDALERTGPTSRVFPKVAKCAFQKYGPSGTVERLDGLCLLPINIVNEKVYVILWFWFVPLTAVSAVALLYRLAVYASSPARTYLLKSRIRGVERLDFVVGNIGFGDWFLLDQLRKNINKTVYQKLLESLADRLQEKRTANTLQEP